VLFSVPRIWSGETCAILAGGPSLRGFDAESLRGQCRVITINGSWRMAPWADVTYWCDRSWFIEQSLANPRSLDSSSSWHEQISNGFLVAGEQGFADHPQIHQMQFSGQMGLETDSSKLRHGSNAGYQAINLAYHFGVSKILLLGYDMHCDGARTHWHEGYGKLAMAFSRVLADSMLPLFNYLVKPLADAGVEVVNCTPGSALKCWPYQPIEAALQFGADYGQERTTQPCRTDCHPD